eukprot:4638059-Ditylum_brightwellii.AAC.1
MLEFCTVQFTKAISSISGIDGIRRGLGGKDCRVVITKKWLFLNDEQQACWLVPYMQEREVVIFQEEASFFKH